MVSKRHAPHRLLMHVPQQTGSPQLLHADKGLSVWDDLGLLACCVRCALLSCFCAVLEVVHIGAAAFRSARLACLCLALAYVLHSRVPAADPSRCVALLLLGFLVARKLTGSCIAGAWGLRCAAHWHHQRLRLLEPLSLDMWRCLPRLTLLLPGCMPLWVSETLRLCSPSALICSGFFARGLSLHLFTHASSCAALSVAQEVC